MLSCHSSRSDMQAVTRNELYGHVHPSTREWREGLISTTFRDMSNNKINKHQWILLDGDIDAEWIEVSSNEACRCIQVMCLIRFTDLRYGGSWFHDRLLLQSMNTVMDDNKMLTLASNERIPLTDTMRLLLEINHMNHCSPATVSRGGVIYINAQDVGWRPVGSPVLLSCKPLVLLCPVSLGLLHHVQCITCTLTAYVSRGLLHKLLRI